MPLCPSYASIRSRSVLAANLGVPLEALDLVSLCPSTCKTEGCPFPSAKHNKGVCVDCGQFWYPKEKNKDGVQLKKGRRGHGLYGRQFMRLYGSAKSPPPACCCSLAICEKIGYSHEGMMCLPSDPSQCEEALKALNVPSDRRGYIVANPGKYRVAPWHFDPRHRRRSSFNNNWVFRQLGTYMDADGKKFGFPPPNYSPLRFIENEIAVSDVLDDNLPDWVRKMASKEEDVLPGLCSPQRPVRRSPAAASTSTPASTPNKRRKAPGSSRKRNQSPESIALEDVTEELRIKKAELESALSSIEGLKATVEVLEKDKIRIRLERDQLKEENVELRAKIEDLEQKLKGMNHSLSYDDIKPGGLLGKHVHNFTFFPNFECNDAFLEVLNYSEACEEGKGVCENLARHSTISIAERKKYNEKLCAERDGDGNGGEEDVEAEYEAAIR